MSLHWSDHSGQKEYRRNDPGDEFETLQSAASRLLAAGFPARSHLMRCYVLIGYPKDTYALAATRLNQSLGRLHADGDAVAA
jgi:hypothetical protein